MLSRSSVSNSLQPHRDILPGCLSMGILQARILEWVAMPSSRGSSNTKIEPRSPTLQEDSLLSEPWGKPKNIGVDSLSLLQGNFPNSRGSSQVSNWSLLHCRQMFYQLSSQGSLLYVRLCGKCFSVAFQVNLIIIPWGQYYYLSLKEIVFGISSLRRGAKWWSWG